MFGHIFCDDVGSEPGSIINELGGFPVKESKFRREMEKLRNSQQRDLSLEVGGYCKKHAGYVDVEVLSSEKTELALVAVKFRQLL